MITEREAEVLAALRERLTNTEIAAQLHISVRTVESHVSALLRKLGAANRRDLAGIALRSSHLPSPLVARPLPPKLNAFFGRSDELEDVLTLLRTARFVTVTGPAGVGKTRLALEVAARASASFADGAAFVDLSGAFDETTVVRSFASAVGVRDEAPGELRSRVLRVLHSDRLVVVDNCEHVMNAAARLILDAVAASDDVRVLATSRESLAVPGERVLGVRPLDILASTALFLDRAKAVDVAFDVADEDERTVESICRRLDGLPLAIELAAAQAPVLTPQQIDDRLGDRFALLRAPARGILDRHEALETALRWSYDLLDARERVLLDRLAVFRGPFGIEAVEAVVPGPPVEQHNVISLLGALVRKSLVTSEANGGQRSYRLLETIREYSWSRLTTSGELDELQRRHAGWAIGLMHEAAAGLHTDAQAAWFERLDVALPNLESALAWKLRRPGEDAGVLEPIQALRNYWLAGGLRRPAGLRWLTAAVDAASSADARTRTRALLDGVLLLTLNDLQAAIGLADRAENVARGDRNAEPYAALARAIVAVHRGHPAEDTARAAMAGLAPDDALHWWARGMLAFELGRQGRYVESMADLSTVVDGFLGLGDEHLAAGALSYRADLALAAGRATIAHDDATRALDTARRFACASCQSQALASLVLIERRRGEHEQLERARDALRLAYDIGETWNVLTGLDIVAGALLDFGQLNQAARIVDASRQLRADTGYAPVLPSRSNEIDRIIHASIGRPPNARKDEPTAPEQVLDLDAAVALALG